jgi:hypothetical protein
MSGISTDNVRLELCEGLEMRDIPITHQPVVLALCGRVRPEGVPPTTIHTLPIHHSYFIISGWRVAHCFREVNGSAIV